MEKTFNLAGHEITLKKQEPLPLSKEETEQMLSCFKSYRNAKEKLDRRIIENENWFKGEHWQYISGTNPENANFRPAGAYLLNGVWHEAEDLLLQPRPRDCHTSDRRWPEGFP